MKRILAASILTGALVAFVPVAHAGSKSGGSSRASGSSESSRESSSTESNAPHGQRGGIGPCLASYYIGPRAGYQMNEGSKIRTLELIEVFIAPLRLYDAYLAWNGEGWSKIVKEENLGR